MLALFCLRLALGMLACLWLLPPRLIQPRFYRTHCLVALGLGCLAAAFPPAGSDWQFFAYLVPATALAFLASIVWRLNRAPGGQTIIVLTAMPLFAALWRLETLNASDAPHFERILGGLTSAFLLGAAMSAMLLGHSYLIAPGMSLQPLNRLLAAIAVAIVLRAAVDGGALWRWYVADPRPVLGSDALLWLPVRWIVGFTLPAGLTWMAWHSAKTSTQSATGILYVVVIFVFLGELTALLLRGGGWTM